jgi:hypothetical protein
MYAAEVSGGQSTGACPGRFLGKRFSASLLAQEFLLLLL